MTRKILNGRRSRWLRYRKAMAVTLGAGTMFASSCSTEGVRAVIDGIDAATRSLDGNLQSQDTTFGEWLLGELIN